MSAAPTRSTQLDRDHIADDLVGQWVEYLGRVGSRLGHRLYVTHAYDGMVTLAEGPDAMPVLSFVPLTNIQPEEK